MTAAIDVSIVLNCHNEAPFIRRALRSLEEASLYAGAAGLAVELIVVLDRPSDAVVAEIDAFDYSAFAASRFVTADVGSLSAARNAGIELASGAFITTADGDDLIAYNLLVAMHRACTSGPQIVGIAKYLFGFGASHHLTAYADPEFVNQLAMVDGHLYTSRIMVEREAFAKLRYEVFDPMAYAYEDWHLNQNLIAMGYTFQPVDSWLFYRQRSGSIMSQVRHSTRLPPPSRLLNPTVYLRTLASEYAEANAGSVRPPVQPNVLEIGSQEPVIEYFRAANKIDPGLHIGNLRAAGTWVPPYHVVGLGAAYYDVCNAIGTGAFTDVAMVPFLPNSGADKYLLDALREIHALDPSRRTLVLCGERWSGDRSLYVQSDAYVTVDLAEICARWSVDDGPGLAARVLSSACPTGTVHILPSAFTNVFLDRHWRRMNKNRVVYYHFCNERYVDGDADFTPDYNLSVLSEVSNLDLIVSDQKQSGRMVRDVFGASAPRTEVLYTRAPKPSPLAAHRPPGRTLRLAWAARLDHQKRPDLLPLIGRMLKARGVDATIDVYGFSVFSKFDPRDVTIKGVVRYLGPFKGVHNLDPGAYDAFLYTSRFDGIPIVLIEAMAAGLMVIAPRVGGIDELVTDETGMLIENNDDNELMAAAYVDGIEALAAGRVDRRTRVASALALIQSRHSDQAYRSRVRQIFLESAV